MNPLSIEPLAAWNEALARLQGWVPAQEPGPLLAELSSLPVVKARLPAELDTLRGLLSRHLKAAEPRPVDPPAEHVRHPLFAVLATQEGYVWPWDDADARIRELHRADPDTAFAESARWATLAQTVAPGAWARRSEACGPVMWLSTCLRLRQRPHWVPAAVAIAELCVGALADTSWARDWEAACAAITAKPGTSDAAAEGRGSRRHRLVLAVSAAMARGGAFAGKDAAAWRKEIKNIDDASAVAGALLLRGQAGAAAEVLTLANTQFSANVSYQSWDEARKLLAPPYADAVPPELRERLLAMLLDAPPKPRQDGAVLEDLYDAGVTLRWLRASDLSALEPRLLRGRLAGAPGVVRAVETTDYEASDRIREALTRLAPSALNAVPPLVRVATFAEAFTLLAASPAVGALHWPDIAGPTLSVAGLTYADGRRGPPSILPTSSGTVEDVGWIDVSVMAVAYGYFFQSGLHKRELDGFVSETGDSGKERRLQQTRGLRRLVAARWRRSVDATGRARWLAHPQATQAVATHIVRRCMSADGDDEAMRVLGETVLAVIAADAPASDVRDVRADANAGKSASAADAPLWARVEESLPDTPRGERLRTLTAPALDMERARIAGDEAAEAQAFARLTEMPALHPLRAALLEAHALSQRVAAEHPFRADPVGPRAAREWWQQHVVDLSALLARSSHTIAQTLREGSDVGEDALHRHIVDLAREEVLDVAVPMVSGDLAARWESALVALRALARLQPWHVERAIDDTIGPVRAWLATARANDVRRAHLVEQLRHAMGGGDEELVATLTSDTADQALLDDAFLREVGNFYLGRLNFGAARTLPGRAEVPGALGYYSKLVFGVIGGPLAAIQTNYIWEPLIESVQSNPFSWNYWTVVGLMFGICLVALVREARRRLPNLDHTQFVRRCAPPFLLLFVGNYGINEFVYDFAGKDLPHLWTVLLWGSLSMYLGVFFGLIAQGGQIDERAE